MKHYNTKIIRDFIENRKDEIAEVECGMREDWSWTAETVWEDGKYLIDMSNESVQIAGIVGSQWATPIMEVTFNDGHREIVDCFTDDNVTVSPSEIAKMKLFTTMTGGMDYKESEGN